MCIYLYPHNTRYGWFYACPHLVAQSVNPRFPHGFVGQSPGGFMAQQMTSVGTCLAVAGWDGCKGWTIASLFCRCVCHLMREALVGIWGCWHQTYSY